MQQINTQRWSARAGIIFGRFKNPSFAVALAATVAILVVLLLTANWSGSPSRAETYKKVSGSAAGLNAAITFNEKPAFGFNVYIFGEGGQQVSVVQPDKDGKVNAALPEGTYIMLVSKPSDKNKLFPQERIVLKNGQELELKLQYKN